MNETDANKVLEQYGKEKIKAFTDIRDQQAMLLKSRVNIGGKTGVSSEALTSAMVDQGVPQAAAEVLVSFIL